MSSSKKYEYQVEQTGDTWSAKVTRKINSRKRATTKEMGDFASEAEAKNWAEEALAELTNTQRSSNDSQLKKRKENEEIKRQRSARRAIKTERAKAEAAAAEAERAKLEESQNAQDEELID